MESNSNKNAMQDKKRSKGAKIVLWAILGCLVATLVVMGVMLIIAACGGTGTCNGSILGLQWNVCTTVCGFFAVALVLAWLLTEPSFKKEEEVFEVHDIYGSYVKKAETPRPVAKNANTNTNNEVKNEKPANTDEVSADAAETAPVDEGAKKKSEPLS